MNVMATLIMNIEWKMIGSWCVRGRQGSAFINNKSDGEGTDNMLWEYEEEYALRQGDWQSLPVMSALKKFELLLGTDMIYDWRRLY